jgi:hypothetical protein
MRIVESGARRDLGQLDAALVALQGADLDRGMTRPWSARLWYAYAETLLALGREEQAREWFLGAASVDTDGATDAAERLLELDGITLVDDDDYPDDDADYLEDDEADTGAGSDAAPDAATVSIDREPRVGMDVDGQAGTTDGAVARAQPEGSSDGAEGYGRSGSS